MYVNQNGNVVCICSAVGMPEYREEAGAKHTEITLLQARCREESADGTQTVALTLLFFGNMAIPAMKITSGQVLVVMGRERSNSMYVWGKHRLDRTLFVDWWDFRCIDPGGMLTELSTRREIAVKDREYRQILAEYLTEIKPTIIKWVFDEMKRLKAENANKQKEADQQ